MLKIGLTGGIGSGKSKVTEFFTRLGVPVIDADVIARALTFKNSQVIQAITQHFGAEVIDSEGKIIRSKLRDIIFSNNQERIWLEQLLHPIIIKEMQQQAENNTFAYCILVAPLLFESALMQQWLDRVLVVDAPEARQIEFTMQRDKVSQDHVRKIMQSQLSREERLERADDVIVNDADLNNLFEKVQKMHQFYIKLSQEGKNKNGCHG